MNYQRERDEFIAQMAQAGVNLDTTRAILRDANTMQRLNAAECSGYWPCDNGERKVKPCAKCEAGYAPGTLSKAGICPNCRAQQRVEKLLSDTPFTGEFQGDPRGCCTQLVHRDDPRRRLYVPTRRY